MAEVIIRPATPAPAVQANSRDTRVVGVHPEQTHITNGAAVKVTGGPGAAITANMGPSGARVKAPNQGKSESAKPIATTERPPLAPSAPRAAGKATAAAPVAPPKPELTLAEAALALEIVEGQVAQVVMVQAAPSATLELAKDVVRKLRAIAGVPDSVPLPWDLAPPPVTDAPPTAAIAPPANDPVAPPASAVAITPSVVTPK
jgi:hypothetical protein